MDDPQSLTNSNPGVVFSQSPDGTVTTYTPEAFAMKLESEKMMNNADNLMIENLAMHIANQNNRAKEMELNTQLQLQRQQLEAQVAMQQMNNTFQIQNACLQMMGMMQTMCNAISSMGSRIEQQEERLMIQAPPENVTPPQALPMPQSNEFDNSIQVENADYVVIDSRDEISTQNQTSSSDGNNNCVVKQQPVLDLSYEDESDFV